MRYFTLLHDFKGEEAVELTVQKGEVVFAVDNTVQDGWLKVESIDESGRRGFVPLSYLQEITPEEAGAARGEAKKTKEHSPAQAGALESTPSPSRQQQHPTPNRRTGPSTGTNPDPRATSASAAAVSSWRDGNRALGETALSYGEDAAAAAAATTTTGLLRSPRETRSMTSPHQGRRSSTLAGDSGEVGSLLASAPLTPARAATGGAVINRDLLSNPNTVVEAFMKNEVYFKQLMRRRADALAEMQSGLVEAEQEVAVCKDRSAALTRKLRDLDQVIEKERRRWTERIEEEKAFVGRSLTYGPVSGTAGLSAAASLGGTPSRSGGSRQPSPMSGRRGSGVDVAGAYSTTSPSVF